MLNFLATCSNMCSMTVGILNYAHSSRYSHFWRLRTPCLLPLGMRSWEGLQCLWTYHPHQTSHSQYPLWCRSHLRRQTRHRLHFWNYISLVSTTVYFRSRNVMNGWLACLCVVSASSPRMSWAVGCQQQKASWSCSRSSCHCEEERSSLVSAEHSHT